MANWDKIKANAELLQNAIDAAAGHGIQAHSASVDSLYELFFYAKQGADGNSGIDFALKGDQERYDAYKAILKAIDAVLVDRASEIDSGLRSQFLHLRNRYADSAGVLGLIMVGRDWLNKD